MVVAQAHRFQHGFRLQLKVWTSFLIKRTLWHGCSYDLQKKINIFKKLSDRTQMTFWYTILMTNETVWRVLICLNWKEHLYSTRWTAMPFFFFFLNRAGLIISFVIVELFHILLEWQQSKIYQNERRITLRKLIIVIHTHYAQSALIAISW